MVNWSTYYPIDKVKRDLFDILRVSIPEIPLVKEAIETGQIDGGQYYGACRCIKGWIRSTMRTSGRPPMPLWQNPWSPVELYITDVEPGDTPGNNKELATLYSWIREFEATYLAFERPPAPELESSPMTEVEA